MGSGGGAGTVLSHSGHECGQWWGRTLQPLNGLVTMSTLAIMTPAHTAASDSVWWALWRVLGRGWSSPLCGPQTQLACLTLSMKLVLVGRWGRLRKKCSQLGGHSVHHGMPLRVGQGRGGGTEARRVRCLEEATVLPRRKLAASCSCHTGSRSNRHEDVSMDFSGVRGYLLCLLTMG